MNLSARPRGARPTPVKRGRWLTGSALGLTIAALSANGAPAQTLPGGANIANQTGVQVGAPANGTLTVTQTAQKAVIDWTSFSVGAGGTVVFDHTNATHDLTSAAAASYVTLNRVTGGTFSAIDGTVKSALNGDASKVGGSIWLLNPNGVLIGSSGAISARGFVATTASITDADFFNDNLYNFTNGGSSAGVTNYGQIVVANGGYAVLAGQQVDNNSLIRANLGRVVLAGVPTFTLDITGDSLLSFAINEGAAFQTAASVTNGGTVTAQGGKVLMTARAAAGITGSVVNLQGLIEAQTATVDGNGQVVLSGTGGTAGEVVIDGGANATVINGFIDQNGARAGGVINVNSQMETDAGSITVLGNSIDIGLTQQAKLLASGVPGADAVTRADGGTISIGRGLANTQFANAPLANRINIGPQSSSNFDRSVNPNGLAIVEVQARAFGGTGRTGGTVYLHTKSGPDNPTAQINTSGFVDVQASGNFQGIGGLNGTGGTVEVVTQNFTLKPSGTITANSATSPGNGGGGGHGGVVRIAGRRLVTQGDPNAPFDTRISASGNIDGGGIYFGAGPDGGSSVGNQPLAEEVWVGFNSSFRASAADLTPGSTGGDIIIGGATDGAGSSVYIDGGLSARGGHGGHIETFGQRLQITGAASNADIDSVKSGVDAGGYAEGGSNGTWHIFGRNLTVKGAVTPQTPDFLGGTGGQAIDGRVLGGALGSFVAGPVYGATNIDIAESRFGAGVPTKISILGPIEVGGARDVTLKLSSDDEIDITGAITGDPALGGKLEIEANADLIRIRDDGQQGTGVRSLLTRGGDVALLADNIEISANRAIDTSVASGTSGDITLIGSNSIQLHGGAMLNASSPGGAAGTIGLYGSSITIGDAQTTLETRILASGTTAGAVEFGADVDGNSELDISSPLTILVNPLARIEADGLGTANGGAISLWSSSFNSSASTTILGKLYARSGLQGGDGGTIVAGGHYVRVEDNARLDTTATFIGGDVRLAGNRIDVDTNASTVENPVGIFAWGLQGGGEINVGAGLDGVPIGDNVVALNVNIGPTSRLNANAIETGQGGKITIWSKPHDSNAVTVLGGSLAVDSTGLAGTIDVGGYDIRLGGVRISALGAGASISIAEGTGYESGYGSGYGYGSFAEGGPVSLLTGSGANIDIDGDFDTSGGSFAIDAGDDADIRFAGFLSTGGGAFKVDAGARSFVEIAEGSTISAFFDATGNSISFNLGADSWLQNYGELTTGSNSITLTGGDGAAVDNGGSISSNGGAISITVGGHNSQSGDYAYIQNYGELDSGGGAITLKGGNGAEIYSSDTILSRGGDVEFTVGDAVFVTESDGYGNAYSFYVGGTYVDGLINTVAGGDALGDFTVTAGANTYSDIYGAILTGGGDIRISHGANGSIGVGGYALASFSECSACGTTGVLDAGLGNVELSADSIHIESSYDGEVPGGVFGGNIRLDADDVDIFGQVAAANSITIAPRTASRAINIGGTEDVADSLSLSDFELDNIGAPTVVLGRADGTGAVNIFITPDRPDTASLSCIDCSSSDVRSTTIVQAGGAGGTIAVHGQGETDDLETIRLVAGSNITLAEDFGLLVNGKLELVSGGSFTNLSGADALATAGDGQWLVYSADPSLDSFGGLLSGQAALWGQSFADVAANGLAHSGNRYAFGLAPSVTVTALNRTKTYGDTLDLSAPMFGTGYTIIGLVNAAQFGNVFTQDVITGVPTLASSGSGAAANAGSYAIVAGSSSSFATPAGYSLVFQSGLLTVDPRLLTVALTGSTQKVYDATTAATLSGANYSLAGFVNGDGATVGQTGGSFASAKVGSNIGVTASLGATDFVANAGTALSNYVLPTSASGSIGSITPATLTYVANPASRQRNNPNPPLSGQVTGFVGGETQATATTGTLAFATTATTDSPAGSYAINGGGLSAGNYVFVQAPGNANALLVQDNVAPAQQVTTEVIQQVTSAIRTPTAAPAPTATPIVPGGTTSAAGATTGALGSLPARGSSVVGTPPPPPPPLAPPPASGTNAPPPGPSVAATPPSPVGETAPPTPTDAADQGDPVLAEAGTEEQDEAPTEKRQLASTTVVAPGVNVQAPTPPRPPEVPGADQSFSGSGNPAQW